MDKLDWTTTKEILVTKYAIPCSEYLEDQENQVAGIRRDVYPYKTLKIIFWPIFKLIMDCFVDGFIEKDAGRLINEFVTETTVFLDVGCGDMSLRKQIPGNICYNAFDLSFSEFHLRRVLKEKRIMSIALASATNIPLESNTVNLIVSTECFEHIPKIDRAIDELFRISMPGAKLICSIPNNRVINIRKKDLILVMLIIGHLMDL